jgi:ATP-dependent helicase/nuclease subunit A
MSGRTPTAEQLRAIEADASEAMVEAGAGTGKTGVMVDRYCRLVCEQGVPPDAVLTFTFTEKAAAELRQRIRSELTRRAESGSARAAELLPGLGSAWVTTIHGFCNRLLSAHPVAVGIDPRFRVLDAPETERAASEAFDEALAEFLAGGEREREATAAAYDVGGLRSVVVSAHAELRSRGWERPTLPPTPEIDASGPLRRAHEAAVEALAELKPENGNRALVERAVEALADPDRPPSLEEMASYCTKLGGKGLAAYREATDEALVALAGAGEGAVVYGHLAELLRLFGERFAATKERRAGIDFEDLQLLAVRLLERSEAGAFYQKRFAHLLVDEFQDTNRLQLRLIEALRGPGTQTMVVGDELQSIYGFRHADLDVFRERREAISAAGGSLLPLTGNFRSRPEVIGAVNDLGERLLGTAYRPLRVGAEPQRPEPVGGRPAVELLLTSKEGWDEEGIDLHPATDARTPLNQLAEARFLAERLRELREDGVDPGSMVVLLRAFTNLDAHEDSLERAGLRPYVVGGRGYWSQQQVADVCAMLAALANPLDDKALLGALASPACGVSPDTLWLLRAAAGARKHLWPTLREATGSAEEKALEPERLEQIPAAELSLLREFAETVRSLRRRAPSLSLPGLIDTAVTETGYDLAVLMRPSGEARFANVRKLMRLAAEFETAEGRDLRGLLDFLAARADSDADAQAATAVEGHDGVRIMTIHSAKGLEFDVVAVPGLARRLLRPGSPPALTIGHEPAEPRVGMQLRRLGARGINVYDQRELCEDAQRREAEEELRLFHVAATRARERLLLSGVVNPGPPRQDSHGIPILERIVTAFDIDREQDSAVAVPAPEARPELGAVFKGSEIAVSVNLPSAERAKELARIAKTAQPPAEPGEGPAPLVERRPPRRPNRPLSYTAIAAQSADPEEPLLDSGLVLGDGGDGRGGTARGRAVHSLLEWSQLHDWAEPPVEVVARIAEASADPGDAVPLVEAVLDPFRRWLGSPLFESRVRDAHSRSEVAILAEVAGTPLRGSIDLLVEGPDTPPLILDYKTDRLAGSNPVERAAHYEIQQAIYGLAVAEARGADRVDLAYVFLERPDEPVVASWGEPELAVGRRKLEEAITRLREG